eukprot:4910253-Prymnesium_polylepis.1
MILIGQCAAGVSASHGERGAPGDPRHLFPGQDGPAQRVGPPGRAGLSDRRREVATIVSS